MRKSKALSILLTLVILVSSFQLSFAVDLDNITEYNMEIVLNTEENIIEGKQDIRFINTYDDDLDELVFHLYADSYESYETLPSIGGIYLPEGEELPQLSEEEKGSIDINQVIVDGEEVKYTEDNQLLKIEMEDSIEKGEEINIKIEFILKIPQGHHRLHYMEGVYSLTNWHPILSVYDEESDTWNKNPYHPIGESNYSDVSNYNVQLVVPKEMEVAPTGTIVEEIEAGENKTVNIKAENVRDFVILMSPNYEIKTKEVDGIKISAYYLENERGLKEETADILLEEVAKTVEFMNKTFGKYAYDELRIAETYLSGGAMEYPQVIQMGTLSNLSHANISERAPWLLEAAVHETIHQWWYVGVGSDEFNESFLDESLTVFTTAYYFQKEYGDYHGNGINHAIRRFIYPSDTKPFNSSVEEFSDWGEYSRVIYNEAPAFFEDLRQRVGEEKFIEIFRTYYETYLFKNASIDGLLEIIGEIAGKEVEEVMTKGVSEPNYYPENIKLTPEEERVFYAKERIGMIEDYEQQYGLIAGSIILRGLKGEKVILVSPKSDSKEAPEENGMMFDGLEELKSSIEQSLTADYGIEIDIVDEENIIEEQREENLIIIGNPKKSNMLKEMAPKLPIAIDSATIEVNKLSIENENTSGMFISENPYNEDSLAFIIFLDDENGELGQRKVETPDGTVVIYSEPLSYKYNPAYNLDTQFVIDVDNIEIRGMYK